MADIDRLIGFMAIMQVPYMNDPDALAYIEEVKTVLKQAKTQEPRVMTLEEIQDGECYWFDAGKDFEIRPVICVCYEKDARKRYVCFAWQFGTFCCEADDYGKTWLCWTSRPTDEQREAVKWDAPN